MRRKLIRKYKKWKENRLPEILMPYKVTRLRKKKEIKVLFLISDLSMWKTESLYKAMLQHPRFNPHIYVRPTWEINDTKKITEYLDLKGYKYTYSPTDTSEVDLWKEFKSDIIFYQKPYEGAVDAAVDWHRNRKSLICFVNYGFHAVDEEWCINTLMLNAAWQVYYENELNARTARKIMTNKGENVIVTGLPIQDDLMGKGAEDTTDPWKKLPGNRKRIIWAPHHTIIDNNWIVLSTFLTYADYMLELAAKYSDEVQWTFKPHPLLKPKLDQVWGVEKANEYYRKWAELPNAQVEMGKYAGLFLHSDAMIHDCASFTAEYLFSGNPAMYLVNDMDNLKKDFNEFQTGAFMAHTHGFTKSDIDDFVKQVIAGKDSKKEEREIFIKNNLTIPGNTTATENIINSILGNI